MMLLINLLDKGGGSLDNTANRLTTKASILAILTLAIPAVIDNFFQTILGFVDTLFVAKIGLVEVSAIGVSNAILAIYFAIFMSLGVSANVYVAKSVGANNEGETKKVVSHIIILAVILGVLFGLISWLFAKPLLLMMGVTQEVLGPAKMYFQIVSIPSIIISLTFAISSILKGAGDTKTPMKISIVVNLLNIALDYILIFGFFFVPGLGLMGAALATVLSRCIGVLGLFYYLIKNSKVSINNSDWKIDKKLVKKIISLSSPAAAERLVMRIGQVLYFGIIMALGTYTFAAHQIAGNIEVFSYMIGYGFATAATTLIGQHLGANDRVTAKHVAKLSVMLGTGIMTLFGIFLFVGSSWLGALFTTDADVIEQIKIALQIDAFIQPILAVVLILTGVYQGGENTKIPFYTTLIGIWLIRVVGVYVLGVKLNYGIAGIWIAIGLDNLFRAIWLWILFQKDSWSKKEKQKGQIAV
jgi:putative MATE family efflux protein